jgi:hypothetical protein
MKNNKIMELIFIKRDSKEWEYMWDKVAKHPINDGYEEPTLLMYQGEIWQYMGSVKNKSSINHEFRHRNHPKFKKREYIVIPSSKDFLKNKN